MRREIPVETLREFFSYDPKSGEIHYLAHRDRRWFKSDRLWKSWNAQFGGKVASGAHGDGYRTVAVNQSLYLAHRVIWAMVTGEWPKDEIDHINGDRGDNRWINLRLVTREENARNAAMPSNNTSGATGVCWHKPAKLWQAYGGARGNRVAKYAKTFDEAVELREQIKQQLGMTERHGT